MRFASFPSIHCVYADSFLLVYIKPAGLLSVPGRGPDKQDSLSSRVQSTPIFADARVVHRLDMATSGLMLMARGLDMHRKLSALFEKRVIAKQYTALVHGCVGSSISVLHTELATGWGLINLPLAADWPNRPRQKVDMVNGKPSETRWTLQSYNLMDDYSRVLLEPLTGRTHQLRLHMQASGHPVLGDTLYAPQALVAKAPRLMLHASRLAFIHPMTGEALVFESQADF